MEKESSTERSTQDQRPSGVLNEGLIGHFKTIREEIVDLEIDSIEPITQIPDYRDPTESIYPIVIKSPDACRCVDGWELIQNAKDAGDTSVQCHVFEMENHSDTEFAIRKVSVRTKPHGGTCSYPEILRNTRLLTQIIMDDRDDLVIFSHGGPRRGANFANNREDDLREILAERLGRSRTTINTYLNQSEYLNDEVFLALVVADIGRSFFDKCRVVKRTLIKNMKSEGIEDNAITTTVSEKMLEWLGEYQETGNVSSVSEEEDVGEPDEPSSNPSNDAVSETQEDDIFQHQEKIDLGDSPVLPSEDTVKSEFQTIITALSPLTEQSGVEIETAISVVDEQIQKLAIIRQVLMEIVKSAGKKSKAEAA